MTEKARRGGEHAVVKMELVKEYNEPNDAGAFSELKTSLALPRHGMRRGEEDNQHAIESRSRGSANGTHVHKS